MTALLAPGSSEWLKNLGYKAQKQEFTTTVLLLFSSFSPTETSLQPLTHWSLVSNTGLQEQNHQTFRLYLCLAVSSQHFKKTAT